MTNEQIIQYAVDEGFAAAEIVDTCDIVFDPSFRPYCEENLCGQYGANYSCPPDCGSPEAMKQRVQPKLCSPVRVHGDRVQNVPAEPAYFLGDDRSVQ